MVVSSDTFFFTRLSKTSVAVHKYILLSIMVPLLNNKLLFTDLVDFRSDFSINLS